MFPNIVTLHAHKSNFEGFASLLNLQIQYLLLVLAILGPFYDYTLFYIALNRVNTLFFWQAFQVVAS